MAMAEFSEQVLGLDRAVIIELVRFEVCWAGCNGTWHGLLYVRIG